MATNRGVKVVDKEITDYYKDINFTEWIGKKVYVIENSITLKSLLGINKKPSYY